MGVEVRLVRKAMFVVLGLTLCFVAPATFGSTVVVGNPACKSGLTSFTTITAAVAASAPGGTIDVCPGTYPEQITITKNLKLIGVASGTDDAAVIVPPAGGLTKNGVDNFSDDVAAQIFVSGANVTISHLTIDGTGNNVASCGLLLEGIYFQNSGGTITTNVVRNQYQTDFQNLGGCQNGLAINVESTGTQTVTISNNSVRSFQKNGITATGTATGPGSTGPNVTISGNHIVGLAATKMNWQTGATAAENGVQVGFGATGKVMNNIVADNIWANDTASDPGDAASGILIYASSGVSVTGNEVASTQFGIVTVSDATYGPADATQIKTNKVAGTQIFDGIDLCSNGNTAQSNTVYGSTEAGVHVDSTCSGTGNNNIVTGNTVNEACAGILTGSGSGNTIAPNTLENVIHTTLAGDSCSAPVAQAAAIRTSALSKAGRPSPFNPNKK